MPFFEAIASTDEGDANWHAATAGLVVLRLVDSWIEDGPRADDDIWPIESVRCSIDALNSHANLRSVLHTIVDVMEMAGRADIHVVAPRLMAYGQLLEYDANWTLATDVYQSLLSHLHPKLDSDACVAAQLRLGYSLKNLNMLDDANVAFNHAFEIASSSEDIVGVLRARIGEAKISMVRGNLSRAEQILDETIDRSVSEQLSEVRASALHDRSSVAHFRGQYELAIKLAYQALELVQSPSQRDRMLSDIATAFMELGVYSAAHDAYMVLAATAQEQFVRWAATINLMELAWRVGSEPHFESHRRELAGVELPPHLATAVELTLGSGYRRFGDLERSGKHFRRALHLATEHSQNQYIFEAEESLLELNQPPRATRNPPASLSLEVSEVAEAIKGLRLDVGV
jgi:tetratricopeptide (TPR) repeat protein